MIQRLKVFLVSCLIVQHLPSLLLPPPPFIHLSLRSGVSLSGSVLHRCVLQLPPAPGPEQEPGGPVRRGRLGQNTPEITKPLCFSSRSAFPTRSFFFAVPLQNLYLFLSQPNCLVHLDLSGTDCSVDSVSVNTGAK